MSGHPASKLGHLEKVVLLPTSGKSPPSIPAKQATAWDGVAPGQLPCWNSALRTSSQLLPNTAWLERLGWDELGCRERTGITFDQVENKPL